LGRRAISQWLTQVEQRSVAETSAFVLGLEGLEEFESTVDEESLSRLGSAGLFGLLQRVEACLVACHSTSPIKGLGTGESSSGIHLSISGSESSLSFDRGTSGAWASVSAENLIDIRAILLLDEIFSAGL